MLKKMTVIGCTMWIVGLVTAIIGLNLTGDARTWVSIVGNVVFLVGLGITGIVWMKKKKDEENNAESK